MQKYFTFYIAFGISLFLALQTYAQSPEKMSYQAVIRNSSGELLADAQVGMQISILQGSSSGSVVHTETHTPTTNANGLVSLQIGTGTIDWANGPYFIKTETDPEGGTNYTISGTSELLTVPYALHAKTAETITGGITETDPVFSSSVASGITATDTANWNSGTSSITESDPVFENSQAANITATDIATLAATSGTNTGDQDISGIEANATDISANMAAIALNTAKTGITTQQASDITANNAKVGYTDALVSANADVVSNTAKVGITTAQADAITANTAKVGITTQQASDITANNAKVGYTDALVSANADVVANTAKVSAATGTQSGEMQYWNGSEWITVAPAAWERSVLTFVGGVPTWYKEGATDVNDVTNPTTGKIWMDRNLGASQVATSSTDAAAYGDLYQWGRGTDGHEKRTSTTTTTLSSSDTPGHGDFITTSTSPFDWRSPQNDNLWQGVNGVNNPCPSGYRLPTETELNAERLSWSANTSAGAFASPLKLPMAGYRLFSTGSLNGVGTFGYYWSSTVSSTNSRYLTFGSSNAIMRTDIRAFGDAVRCLKD